MNFDAVVLIDLWNDEWIDTNHNYPETHYSFLQGLFDFLDKISFNKIFTFTGDKELNELVKNKYSNYINLNSVTELRNLLPEQSDLLVGGVAWQQCLHFKPYGFQNLVMSGYNVYSTPEICGNKNDTKDQVEIHFFEEDFLSWQKTDTFYFLPAKSIKQRYVKSRRNVYKKYHLENAL